MELTLHHGDRLNTAAPTEQVMQQVSTVPDAFLAISIISVVLKIALPTFYL